MGQWDYCFEKLKSLKDRQELWEAAAKKFMIEACTAENGAQQSHMHDFMLQNQQELKASTTMWQATGSALCMGNLDERACKFMSDWKGRKSSTSEGLFALACSLWSQNREHEASEVTLAAVKKEYDWATASHMVMLGLYQVVHGDPKIAFKAVREVDPLGLTRHFQCKYETIVYVMQSLASGESHSELQKQIQEHYLKYIKEFKDDPETIREHKLVQLAIAKLHGKKWAGFKWKFLKK